MVEAFSDLSLPLMSYMYSLNFSRGSFSRGLGSTTMADVAREARASIAALVEAYRARPTTIYVRIVLLASTIFYDWLLFGKQLRPTKDLFIADSEKFVNRWKNMAFSFQIIVAFIPLLGVGTVTPFLVSQRERDEPRDARSASFGSLIAVTRRDAPGAARDTFGARVAPGLAILAVETAIGAAVVGAGMAVAIVVLRFRCFWDMLGLSLMTLAVHAAFFCALALFFETLEPSWLSVSHIVVVLAETQMSGYAIMPAFMKGRGKWFTYLSSLRYA